MLEIGIRVFCCHRKPTIFPDYREHLRLMNSELSGEVETLLKESEDLRIYQYYSLAPFYWMEIKCLRRMELGSSVMCVTESVNSYVNQKHLPDFVREWLFHYICTFLNALDYIVIPNETIERELRTEGICHPEFYKISEREASEDHRKALLWRNLYFIIAERKENVLS